MIKTIKILKMSTLKYLIKKIPKKKKKKKKKKKIWNNYLNNWNSFDWIDPMLGTDWIPVVRHFLGRSGHAPVRIQHGCHQRPARSKFFDNYYSCLFYYTHKKNLFKHNKSFSNLYKNRTNHWEKKNKLKFSWIYFYFIAQIFFIQIQ